MSDGGHYDRVSLYARVEDVPNVEARLSESLTRNDREVAALAFRRAAGIWLFYGPTTAATLWLVDAVWSVGSLVAMLVLLALVALVTQAAITLALALAQLPTRLLALRQGGMLWFLASVAVSAADVAFTGACLYMIGSATEWWGML